jgi:type I restriction enzyme M protein
MVDRTRRELSDSEISRIAEAYHSWRGEPKTSEYSDVPGFCKAETIERIKEANYVLTPGRYVGNAETGEAAVPFAKRFDDLSGALRHHIAKSQELDERILRSLTALRLPND